MKFRYVAFWFYWLAFFVAIAAFVAIGRVIETGLVSVAPSLLSMQTHLRMAVTILSLCVILLAILIYARLQARISHLFPSRSLVLTEDGIRFDLPLQMGGFVAWRDIASVHRTIQIRGSWAIAIEFKHKLPVGPAGVERELSRLILRGDHILPSGEAFLEGAQRYHARATALIRPTAADRSKPEL